MRIIFFVIGVVAAAFVPMLASRLGVPLFWSQALGITSGWFLMMTAFTPRQQRTAKTFLSFAAAGAIATVVSFAFQRVLLPWH